MIKENFWKEICSEDSDLREETIEKLINSVSYYLKDHAKEDIVKAITNIVLTVLEISNVYDPKEDMSEDEIIDWIYEDLDVKDNKSLYFIIDEILSILCTQEYHELEI